MATGYELVKNKEWLTNRYCNEMCSCKQISESVGVSASYVYSCMKMLGIDLRDRAYAIHVRRGNSVNLSDSALEFIYGELLGDGSISMNGKQSAAYQHSTQFEEYAIWLSKMFDSFGIKRSGKINVSKATNGNNVYHYASISYPELAEIRREWYPEGKKITPFSLKITPVLLRQFYIGDGTRTDSGAKLITTSKQREEIREIMKKMLYLGIETTYIKCENSIYIPARSINAFLDYIGPCPDEISVYEYKWRRKLPKKHLAQTGESNNNSKLLCCEISEIRRMLLSEKFTLREIGELYGVSTGAIWQIKSGNNWAGVK